MARVLALLKNRNYVDMVPGLNSGSTFTDGDVHYLDNVGSIYYRPYFGNDNNALLNANTTTGGTAGYTNFVPPITPSTAWFWVWGWLQRIHFGYSESFVAKRIRYENFYDASASRPRTVGINTFQLYGSNDSSISGQTTPYNNLTGWNFIIQSNFDIHVDADIHDVKYIEIAQNTSQYRYYKLLFLGNHGGSNFGFRRFELIK